MKRRKGSQLLSDKQTISAPVKGKVTRDLWEDILHPVPCVFTGRDTQRKIGKSSASNRFLNKQGPFLASDSEGVTGEESQSSDFADVLIPFHLHFDLKHSCSSHLTPSEEIHSETF